METIEQINQSQGDLIEETQSIDEASTQSLINMTEVVLQSAANQTLNVTISEVLVVEKTENQTEEDFVEVNSTIKNFQIEVSYQPTSQQEPSES